MRAHKWVVNTGKNQRLLFRTHHRTALAHDWWTPEGLPGILIRRPLCQRNRSEHIVHSVLSSSRPQSTLSSSRVTRSRRRMPLVLQAQSLRNWHAKLAQEPESCDDDASVAGLQDEIKCLRKRLQRTQMESEILKKNTAYFARESH